MPRATRVCPRPGCPNITPGGPCDTHRRQTEQTRGTRQQRGYDRTHELIRARLLRTFVPGTLCPKCGQPMHIGDQLDAGHSTDLRVNPNARADRLEHAHCNRGWRRDHNRKDPP